MPSFHINICLLLSLFFSYSLNIPLDDKNKFNLKCGYEKCPKYDESKINVHIIAQTHDDVGWIKTIDGYYYTEVQYILDTVVDELNRDPNKKFIYVEMAFFFKWWKEQDDATRKIVERLVQNGQLEFISGGWSMNDEASTYYHQLIDQMTWGFRRLNDTFGECSIPRIGWQIDPFGHSKEQASLFALMNFDAFFFTRLDQQDRNKRIDTKNLEFVWKANQDLGKDSDIFTGILQLGYGYGSPPGMCWDLKRCDTDPLNSPIIDDPESEEYNLKIKVDELIIYTTVFSQHYTTNHVYVTIGSDFQFSSAQSYFKNIDKLIKHTNERQLNGSQFNIFYSTPSCYLQALYQLNKTYETKTDDFFPYGSDPHSYWTGYFTSRPALKFYDRRANNILQVCKQLNALTLMKMDEQTVKLKEALGINQHHDAVSGTEKQAVAFNYALLLSKGIKNCEQVISKAYQKLLPKTTGITDIPNQALCQTLNVSSCEITESNSKVAITLYNPIARNVEQYIRLPVVGNSYQVLSPSAQNVSSDLISIPDYVIQIPERKSKATNEVVFKASIPALGFATYFLKPSNNSQTVQNLTKVDSPFTIKGKSIAVQFDSNGALESIKLSNGQTVSLKQSFYYYKGMKGDNKGPVNRASGAYIFRPDGQTPVNIGVKLNSSLYKGSLVQEVRQRLDSWVSQTIRVYPNEDYIEFDWTVGPIPLNDNIGKEVITRFDSNLTTNGFFYTDANGRQILERKRNFKPTYNVTVTEPVASNYYPVNSRIYMNDKTEDLQITIINDRSQGGSSIQDGSVELMLHRRLLYDDDFGVHEALSEPGFDGKGLVIRGQTLLFLSKINSSAQFHRDFAQRVNLSPVLTFATYNDSEADYMNKLKTNDSTINEALPNNVNILTLEEWKNGSILLRLEHFYASLDDPNGLSKNATVDLSKLFKPFTIKSVSETTLGGNQYLSNAAKRMVFRTKDTNIEKDIPIKEINGFSVTLTPMQIRTFIINIS